MVSFILAKKDVRFLLGLSHFIRKENEDCYEFIFTFNALLLADVFVCLLMAVDREMSDQIVRMMS